MEKRLISMRRTSWALLMGGALLFGTAACSTGTSDGETNVEESDYKDKSPTEHNPEGLSDNTQDNTGQPTPGAHQADSAGEAIYDRQEKKETNVSNSPPGVGGGGERVPKTTN